MKKFLLSLAMLLLAVAPALADTAILVWTANTETDLAGYKVYQSTVAGTYGPATLVLGEVITSTLTLPTLTVDRQYFFTITAYDTSGNESPKSLQVNKIGLVSPGTPVLTLTALSANSIRVAWPNVIAVDGTVALIDIRLAVSPITWSTATSIVCSGSPCTVSGLTPVTAYQLQAVAWRVNTLGGKVFGEISAPVSVTTLAVDLPPAAPSGVTVR